MAKKATETTEAKNTKEYIDIATGEVITVNLDKCKVIKVQTKLFENNEKNQKFFTHKAIQKNGKLMSLKFTREAKNTPQQVGTSLIAVELENMNIDKVSSIYPTLWVKNVLFNITETETLSEQQKEDLDEAF